jgi:hypothetical protein
MNIDQVIQTCRSIAEQHYPDDAARRNEYLVGLLETKLREVAHRAEEFNKAGLDALVLAAVRRGDFV